MIQFRFFICTLILTVSVCSLKATDTPKVPVSSERMLCTTMTQSQQVRFNRCRNGEVMTGIQNLEPLTIYCTTLLANCRHRNPQSEEFKRLETQ